MPSRMRGESDPAVDRMIKPITWMTATPRLPPPALIPSAAPFFRSGKKALILVIDEAKLPPPTPATAATIMNVVYDVPGSTTTAARIVGISSRPAAMIDQFRPPKTATAIV